MSTLDIALSQSVIESGVLPDNENPRDLAIEEAPVSQAPIEEDDSATWGFVKQGRRFRASLSISNLTWAIAVYAPEFGIVPDRGMQFIEMLKGVAAALGEDASPDELYVVMRDLLAQRNEPEERPLHDAYYDLWAYQAEGGYIFDHGVTHV